MLAFRRSILGHPSAALRREWLVTNGIGGYAMGSLLANAPTRKYHGLLIAALRPPLGRTNLVAGLDIRATYAGVTYALSGFEHSDGTVGPGYRQLDQWTLDRGVPTAIFTCAEARISQRIWMEHGSNTTYVQLRHEHGSEPLLLGATPLLTERDHHDTDAPTGWQGQILPTQHGATMPLTSGGALVMASATAAWEPAEPTWRDNIHYRVEHERGHDADTTLLEAGGFVIELAPGETVTLVFSTEASPDLDGQAALERAWRRAEALVAQAALPADAPPSISQLVLTADQCIVRRDILLPSGATTPGTTVIAGYPWFSDWGRDTMIALPGLFLATGRLAEADQALRTWGSFLSQGMLPNRFPDIGDEPEYNTVDATLWFVQAIRATHALTGDTKLIEDLFPALEEIVAWHRRGTRYSIKVAEDGLLTAGEPDVQLTWMDAKYEGWVVTPRQGKAVEINALWYSALRTIAEFARLLGRDDSAYDAAADDVARGFERFWSAEHGYLYDVVDGPEGDDPALRPNQLIALALPHRLVDEARARSIVAACARHLWASVGLRSLAPHDPEYIGDYGGDLETRDGAYHQGTAWGWLIGPFIMAYADVYGPEAARALLEPFDDHLSDAGIGSISEIFDGNAPWTPRGCPWQAWSVAEVLRCWRALA